MPGPSPSRTRLSRRFGVVAAGVVALGLAACSDEAQTEYRAENTDGFFTACTDATIDSVLHTRLCQCVVDELTAELDFTEFAELDAEMAADPPPATSSVIIDAVADCVIDVAEL